MKPPNITCLLVSIINKLLLFYQISDNKSIDNKGNEILNDKGKPVLIKSYSLLQDRFYKYMSDNGYKDFIRGEKGSTAEHLSDLEYKAKKEKEKLKAITVKVKEQQAKFAENTSAIEDSEKQKSKVRK